MKNIALKDIYIADGVGDFEITDLFGSVPAPPTAFRVEGTVYAFSRAEVRDGDLCYWEFRAQTSPPNLLTTIRVYND